MVGGTQDRSRPGSSGCQGGHSVELTHADRLELIDLMPRVYPTLPPSRALRLYEGWVAEGLRDLARLVHHAKNAI